MTKRRRRRQAGGAGSLARVYRMVRPGNVTLTVDYDARPWGPEEWLPWSYPTVDIVNSCEPKPGSHERPEQEGG